jgi:hypothetical protein
VKVVDDVVDDLVGECFLPIGVEGVGPVYLDVALAHAIASHHTHSSGERYKMRKVLTLEVYPPNVPDDLEATGRFGRCGGALGGLHAHHDPRERTGNVGTFQCVAVHIST